MTTLGDDPRRGVRERPVANALLLSRERRSLKFEFAGMSAPLAGCSGLIGGSGFCQLSL